MKFHIRKFGVAFLILVFVFCSLANAEDVNKRPAAKIGAILSLSGNVASYGKAIQQGIDLALSEGGSADFQVVYEDDQSLNRVVAVSATRKLIDVDKVSVVLDMVVNTATAISPLLNQSKTVGVVMWDSNRQIASLGEYIFGLGYSTELAGGDFGDFATNKLGARNVAIISANDEWSHVFSEAFQESIKKNNSNLVTHEVVNVDTTDFKTIIAKIKAKNADTVLGALYGGALVSWIKQSRELGFKGNLLTGDSVSENEISQSGVENAEGLYASQIWVEDSEFAKRYEAKYGKSVSQLNLSFVSIGYDTIKCLSSLKATIEKNGDMFSSETVRKNLTGYTCSGVTGKFRVDENRLSDRRERILIVREGKFELFQ